MHLYHSPEDDEVDIGRLRRPPAHVPEDLSCALPCPRCRLPMTLRYGRRGVYYHCACAEHSKRSTATK